jgi:hypothetical protein
MQAFAACLFSNGSPGRIFSMSAERMIVNAMQEQPIMLLPVFMLAYFVMHLFKQTAGGLLANHTFTTRLPQ